MPIPNYLYALANHQGPARIKAGGLVIPVRIGNIDHESDPSKCIDKCTFECQVVNQDEIRKDVDTPAIKEALNSVYGVQRRSVRYPWGYFSIEDVKFGNTTTIVWKDGSKTSIICINVPAYSKETTLAMCFSLRMQGITSVVFNNPHTIVKWTDGTETRVKCQEGDVYSKETGLALCFAKKALGNTGNFNDVFHKWIPEEETENA